MKMSIETRCCEGITKLTESVSRYIFILHPSTVEADDLDMEIKKDLRRIKEELGIILKIQERLKNNKDKF